MGGLAAIAVATLLWISCGQVYRPVVIPIAVTPPNAQNFHEIFSVNTNTQANPGTALQIDVSGDTSIGAANMGVSPTHGAILPNHARVFVAVAGSLFPGQSDLVTAFSPAAQSTTATGFGTVTIFTYPDVSPGQSANITSISESGNTVSVNLTAALSGAKVGMVLAVAGVTTTGANTTGYDGSFTITNVSGTTIQYQDPVNGLAPLPGGSGSLGTASLPVSCSYLPDFVATTQNNAVFVANYGVENGSNCNLASTDSVAQLNPATNAITHIAYLPPAAHPVAMVETPDNLNLYVLNQGNGTVMNLSPIDLTTLATISVGNDPVWAVARIDDRRVYVLTQGDGKLVPIDVATNTVLPSQTDLSVGAGANFLLYDPNLNRLYVTNPTTGNVFIYSTTGGVDLSGNPNDTPTLLSTISMTGGANPPCVAACSPVSVAALADGTRFYVASYEMEPNCSDPNVGITVPCIIPMLTIFDAPSMTVKTAPASLLSPSPSMALLTSPLFAATQYGVPPLPTCATPPTYTPGSTRFRMFTASSTDSSHVYVSICDAGSVADVDTVTNTIAVGSNTPDTLKADLVTPFANCITNCPTPANITAVSINSNVVTFTANNTFTAGTRVQISNLTSSAGSQLNGLILTVLASGLMPTQFECNVSAANASANDSGSAVPLSPLQSPVFLFAGQ